MKAWIILTLLFLAGCSTAPRMEKPVDFFAIGYASIKAAANTIAQRSQSGAMSEQTKTKLLDLLQEAHDNLDLGKAALGGDKPETALEWLVKAQNILTLVEKELSNEQSHRGSAIGQRFSYAIG